MDEKTIKLIDESAIKLSSDLYAMMYRGRMIILEKVNVYGKGYNEVVSFSFDDFNKLKTMADKEYDRIG